MGNNIPQDNSSTEYWFPDDCEEPGPGQGGPEEPPGVGLTLSWTQLIMKLLASHTFTLAAI